MMSYIWREREREKEIGGSDCSTVGVRRRRAEVKWEVRGGVSFSMQMQM
jgi:hypothetical protein